MMQGGSGESVKGLDYRCHWSFRLAHGCRGRSTGTREDAMADKTDIAMAALPQAGWSSFSGVEGRFQ